MESPTKNLYLFKGGESIRIRIFGDAYALIQSILKISIKRDTDVDHIYTRLKSLPQHIGSGETLAESITELFSVYQTYVEVFIEHNGLENFITHDLRGAGFTVEDPAVMTRRHSRRWKDLSVHYMPEIRVSLSARK